MVLAFDIYPDQAAVQAELKVQDVFFFREVRKMADSRVRFQRRLYLLLDGTGRVEVAPPIGRLPSSRHPVEVRTGASGLRDAGQRCHPQGGDPQDPRLGLRTIDSSKCTVV